jgi:hypothetical protein
MGHPAFKEEGPVRINCQEWPLKVTFSPENIQSFRNGPITGPGEKRSICPSASITHSFETRE